jgi:carboxypeptidase Taq
MTYYDKYKAHMSKIADVQYAISLLNWDQETYMPSGAAGLRAQQMSTLSGMAHDLSMSEELEKFMEQASSEKLSWEEKKNLEISKKDLGKNKKYTTDFVVKLTGQISNTFIAWQEAKKKNDFSLFSGELDKLIELKKQESEFLGYENHPYEAQLDTYEPGATVPFLDSLFASLKMDLKPLLDNIAGAKQVDDAFMFKTYAKEEQWSFGLEVLEYMGYDFKRGRQDYSSHPFTTNFGPTDVRVTTRVDENNLSEMLWSTIHEGGHALYEQGLSVQNYGLPHGTYCSLSIHESQSRLWENNVGRALPFWEHFFPIIKKRFGSNLADVNPEMFYRAMNKVQSSPIRTNADELSYHLHVIIRYEIEKMIFSNEVKTSELPELWNAKYKEYLGLDIRSDQEGILQDIHWSHGSFGYFPTYSLGSLYAAQFFHFSKLALPDMENEISEGSSAQLLSWLRSEIHQFGKLYSSDELCKKVTGESLNTKYFMDYANEKYSTIYALSGTAV